MGLTPVKPALGRQRQNDGHSSRLVKLWSEMLLDHYHRRVGRCKINKHSFDGDVNKQGKRERNRAEGERGGQDEGIGLVVQI